MADRNGELVPDNWSLERERVLTTGLCWEGWYSEHLGVIYVCEWCVVVVRVFVPQRDL